MKKLGILGGMGPEATILLMEKILHLVEAEDDRNHIPMIVHQNTQVPSRIKAILEGSGASPEPTLKKMALELQSLGCDFLAMPCNTAHYYFGSLSNCVDIPFLNMLEISTKVLYDLGMSRIGILVSPALKKVGVLDPYFEEHGLVKVFPENDVNLLNIIT